MEIYNLVYCFSKKEMCPVCAFFAYDVYIAQPSAR